MCPEWLNDFNAFLAHIGRKPSPELTLDRIDNDGDYQPGNVRWATRQQQSSNRRKPQGHYRSASGRYAKKSDQRQPPNQNT
jgi:hypothetical protein